MFREYDLRGRESLDELNPQTMKLVGASYGTFLRKRGITDAVVGHDSRDTSTEFARSAIEGLLSTGVNVTDCGMILTPMLYWAQYYFKTKGALMVTASHNPRGWNGVKLAAGYSYTLIGDELQEIYATILTEKFNKGKGSVKKEDIKEAYIEDILHRVKITKQFKILVNTGNGTAGAFVPDVLRKVGCSVIEHNTKLDSEYPNYTPNPAIVEMMEDTGKKVVESGCQLGFAFDGDGDRLGLTDEKGQTIWPDRYLILLARQVLLKKPGAKVIFDVLCSEALSDDIKAHGGLPIMWKTGHSYIKDKLAKEKAALAGEISGHIFFVENFYGFDDATFAALKILEYLSGENLPLSEIISKTPHYATSPVMEVDCADDKKYQVVGQLTKEFANEGYEINTLAGVRVNLLNGWGIVRASSNMPVLKFRFEAKNKQDLTKIEKTFRAKVEKFDFVGKEWRAE